MVVFGFRPLIYIDALKLLTSAGLKGRALLSYQSRISS